jgi:hypothetical protein
MQYDKIKLYVLKRKDGIKEMENDCENIARTNEILGWESVGNRQLLCFFKA